MLHTYGSWIFFLCSPDCSKQPRTSFLFYKFSYIILCSKICAWLIQTWLTWFFLRTKSHVSQGFGVDYLGLRFNYDCRTLWFATQQQFCKEHFLLDIRKSAQYYTGRGRILSLKAHVQERSKRTRSWGCPRLWQISKNSLYNLRYRKIASSNASRFVTRLVYMHTLKDNFLIKIWIWGEGFFTL